MRRVPTKNGGYLNVMEKGETLNPHGRPRKYVSELKSQGYKLHEVNDCIQVIMSMTEPEIEEVLNNDCATVLEKTIAKAIKKSIENGSLYSMETLLSRVYGSPKETAEIIQEVKITSLHVEVVMTGIGIPTSEKELDA